jgi:hypothetical protein
VAIALTQLLAGIAVATSGLVVAQDAEATFVTKYI